MKFKRSLEKKLVTLFALSISFLMLFEGALSYWFINNEVREWQLAQLDKSHFVIQNLIDGRYNDLEVLTKDYAYWDVTYKAAKVYETEKVNTYELSKEELPTSHLVGFLLATNTEEVINAVSVYPERLQALLFDELFAIHPRGDTQGLILLQGRLVMFVKKTIKNGTKGEEANSFLVLFREFLPEDITDISKSVGTLFSVEVSSLLEEVTGVIIAGKSTTKQVSLNEDEKRFSATYAYTLANGQDLPLTLKVQMEKQLTSLVKIDAFIVSILVSVLGIAIVMLIGIRRIVVNPIILISKHVAKFDLNKGHYDPIAVSDNSEIGRLQYNINKSFESAVLQHKFNKVLLDSIDDVVITIDDNMQVQYTNPAACKWLNLQQENKENLNLNFALTVVSENSSSLTKLISDSFSTGQPFKESATLRNNMASNRKYDAALSGYKIEEVERQNELLLLIISLET